MKYDEFMSDYVKDKPMTMKNFTINYEGEFDPVDLTNSLKFIIGAGTQVELQINCVIR